MCADFFVDHSTEVAPILLGCASDPFEQQEKRTEAAVRIARTFLFDGRDGRARAAMSHGTGCHTPLLSLKECVVKQLDP